MLYEGKGREHDRKEKEDIQSIPCGISLYHTYFCRVLVCRADVWDIYECIRVQLLVSYAYEPDNLRRFHRICGGQYAAGSL